MKNMNTKTSSPDNLDSLKDNKVINRVESAQLEEIKDNTRNAGLDFRLDEIASISINKSAVERRCSNYGTRRSIKKDKQAAWLLKAISLMDLTTLSGDDTEARVKRLCSKAKQPISTNLENALGVESLNLSVAAVCVYHDMLSAAKNAIRDTQINLAAVSTGFPAGLSPLPIRIQEIEYTIDSGANEIDIVISRRHVLEGNWKALYEEVKIEAFKRGLRAIEIPVPFHARVGEVKLNTWEDGIWNLWFLVTKMRDF